MVILIFSSFFSFRCRSCKVIFSEPGISPLTLVEGVGLCAPLLRPRCLMFPTDPASHSSFSFSASTQAVENCFSGEYGPWTGLNRGFYSFWHAHHRRGGNNKLGQRGLRSIGAWNPEAFFSAQSLYTSSMLDFSLLLWPAFSSQLHWDGWGRRKGFLIEHNVKTPAPVQAITGGTQYMSEQWQIRGEMLP